MSSSPLPAGDVCRPAANEATRETVCAIVPALAEERFIGDVVRGVLAHLDRVIVVDDGSVDRTATVAEAAGAEVIRHGSNRGKGAAIKTGLERGLSDRSRYFLFLDADGQHDPAEVPTFINAARRTGADLIVGNRMGDPDSMPRIRRWTNRLMSWQIGKLCGQVVPDSQCGYRLAHRQLVPVLMASSDGFAFETESLLLASRRGFRIEFIPVRTIYRDERSKIRQVRDTIQYLKLIRKYQER